LQCFTDHFIVVNTLGFVTINYMHLCCCRCVCKIMRRLPPMEITGIDVSYTII
jgi:hypothetical protein